MIESEHSPGRETCTVEILQEILKELKELRSGRIEMARAGQARSSAHRANEEVSDTLIENSREEEDQETYQKDHMANDEPWETVRDTLKDQDQELIESWKDELNNLLIFAGLFSAVVTAFAVQSYPLLQQDPGDASNILLAYISQQLVNSSFPALPLQNATSMFSPPDIAVPINTLWVLSLTLSLISAFFAIAVQQWLRHLRIPAGVPMRLAVQLCQLRYDGLRRWQVHGIISVLPWLLQVAVVLFLVGLFILLRTLNATVTITFAVPASLGLLAFIISAITPLFVVHCPYKSTLAPTLLVILQWISYPLVPCLIAALFIPGMLFLVLSKIETYIFRTEERGPVALLTDYVLGCVESLVDYMRSFSKHMFVDISRFWLVREYKYILHANTQSNSDLESPSWARVLLSIGSKSFTDVTRCLVDFDFEKWQDLFKLSVTQSVGAIVPKAGWDELIRDAARGISRPKIAPYIQNWLLLRHHWLLWRLVQRRVGSEIRDDDPTSLEFDVQCLLLLRKLESVLPGPAIHQHYIKYLLHICSRQSHFERPLSHAPICLFVEVATKSGHLHDEDDLKMLTGFVFKVKAVFTRVQNEVNVEEGAAESMAQVYLASTVAFTIAFAHNANPQAVSMIQGVFQQLLDMTELIKSMLAPGQESQAVLDYMTTPWLMRVLCKTLSDLEPDTLNIILQHLPAADSVIHLCAAIRTMCADTSLIDLSQACFHLEVFNKRLPFGGDCAAWEQNVSVKRLPDDHTARESVCASDSDVTENQTSLSRVDRDVPTLGTDGVASTSTPQENEHAGSIGLTGNDRLNGAGSLGHIPL